MDTSTVAKVTTPHSQRRRWAKIAVLVVVAVLALIALVANLQLAFLYYAIEALDAAVLLGWALLDFRKFYRHRADRDHLRDGTLLAALGVLTIAGPVVAHYRDAPRELSPKQQAAFASVRVSAQREHPERRIVNTQIGAR